MSICDPVERTLLLYDQIVFAEKSGLCKGVLLHCGICRAIILIPMLAKYKISLLVNVPKLPKSINLLVVSQSKMQTSIKLLQKNSGGGRQNSLELWFQVNVKMFWSSHTLILSTTAPITYLCTKLCSDRILELISFFQN